MADTTTPNFGYTLVEVGGSTDTWGAKINGNTSEFDTDLKAATDTGNAAMPKAGGSFSGAVRYATRLNVVHEYDIGFRGAPRTVQNSTYTFALGDAGGMVLNASGAGAAYTIAPDSTTNFPTGSVVLLATTGGTSTVSPGTGVTLLWSGVGTTGARTVTGANLLSMIKLDANFWMITGSGLS